MTKKDGYKYKCIWVKKRVNMNKKYIWVDDKGKIQIRIRIFRLVFANANTNIGHPPRTKKIMKLFVNSHFKLLLFSLDSSSVNPTETICIWLCSPIQSYLHWISIIDTWNVLLLFYSNISKGKTQSNTLWRLKEKDCLFRTNKLLLL